MSLDPRLVLAGLAIWGGGTAALRRLGCCAGALLGVSIGARRRP